MPPELLTVWKRDGVLGCEDLGGHDSRHDSVWRLIWQASEEYSLPDFDRVTVSTADRPVEGALCFCVGSPGDYSRTVPDFLFDSWPEVGVPDYEQTCREVAFAGRRPAERAAVAGWIGNADTSPVRRSLLAVAAATELVEAVHAPWPPDGSARLSLPAQARRWGMLIDVEGNGWSARLKLLLHSGRPVLVVDRPWREWWFPWFVAWVHYVPVARDLADLTERVEWVAAYPEQAAAIGRAGQALAQRLLTRERAVAEWARVLSRQAGS